MKIVCEISGGADSMLSTLYAKEKYPEAELYGFIVDYGQLQYNIEEKKTYEFCKRNNIPLKTVSVRKLFSKGTVTVNTEKDEEDVALVYTPLRNLVLLSMAASYAENIGAEKIITGSKTLSIDPKDPYSFKDSTLPFYKIFEAMLSYVSYENIKVEMILGEGRNNKMTKKEVYQELLDRGYTWNDFWNCFNSQIEECGYCNNCKEKNIIKKQLEIENKPKI